jgi:lysozyme
MADEWLQKVARIMAAARFVDLPMKISAAGLDLLMEFEGLHLTAYVCPNDVWAIGFGHTHDVHEGDTCTEAQAIAWLSEDVLYFEEGVTRMVTRDNMTQGQFDALVAFSYQVGLGDGIFDDGLEDSDLLRLFNEGDDEKTAEEFLRWDKVDNKIDKELTRRREAERVLFLS